MALFLHTYFAQVWDWCQAGQIDAYRAQLIGDSARLGLDTPEQFVALAARITPFLAKSLKSVDGFALPSLVGRTAKQIRNKLSYEIKRLKSTDAEERFRNGFKDRRVRAQEFEDGMGSLGIASSVDQIKVAEARLTLAAKELRAGGDERTLDQLRSDLAIDLLTGRREGVPMPTYARAVVNLTVPIQTVMGLGGDPGVLAGGAVIPAGLARRIAQSTGATWHRLLTDPTGGFAELSTTSYAPTAPLWREAVAKFNTCSRSTCTRPATECDIDHRNPWPNGKTTSSNLWPACKLDHTAKHSTGFEVVETPDGWAMQTPAGFSHEVLKPELPVSDNWTDPDDAVQSPTTESADRTSTGSTTSPHKYVSPFSARHTARIAAFRSGRS